MDNNAMIVGPGVSGIGAGLYSDLKRPDLSHPRMPEQLAKAMTALPRFGGQSLYSVAAHSLVVGDLCAHLAQQRGLNWKAYQDAGFVHVHEGVLGCDIPTPYKRLLGATAYAIEDGIDGEVSRVFGVGYDVLRSEIVRHADREACYAEAVIIGADAEEPERRRWVPTDFTLSPRARSLVEL